MCIRYCFTVLSIIQLLWRCVCMCVYVYSKVDSVIALECRCPLQNVDKVNKSTKLVPVCIGTFCMYQIHVPYLLPLGANRCEGLCNAPSVLHDIYLPCMGKVPFCASMSQNVVLHCKWMVLLCCLYLSSRLIFAISRLTWLWCTPYASAICYIVPGMANMYLWTLYSIHPFCTGECLLMVLGEARLVWYSKEGWGFISCHNYQGQGS